jgi:two-component system, cell cycle sensor histidine kinase and response regulator CckA
VRAGHRARVDPRYAELRLALSERLPIVTYTNLFVPKPVTVWMSPQVERMTGYSAAEWIACPDFFESVLHPDDHDAVMLEVAACRREFRPFSRDYRLLKRDGEIVWIHDESVPVFREDGRPELIQGYFVDITSRKELERQLLHAQKVDALGRLAAEVAHDFNNYLTVIHSHAQLLAAAVRPDAPEQRRVHEIVTAAERAGKLVRRLLDYGRSDPSRPRRVALDELVAGLEPVLRKVAGAAVVLRLDLASTRGVFADASELEQIVVNLVANARDAMPNGGHIEIQTYDLSVLPGLVAERMRVAAGEYVALCVADTGLGIDPAALARIFEPFFTTRREGTGTGLGLAIVDRIVRAAGGGVSVDTAPGRGSRFRVLLPAAGR